MIQNASLALGHVNRQLRWQQMPSGCSSLSVLFRQKLGIGSLGIRRRIRFARDWTGFGQLKVQWRESGWDDCVFAAYAASDASNVVSSKLKPTSRSVFNPHCRPPGPPIVSSCWPLFNSTNCSGIVTGLSSAPLLCPDLWAAWRKPPLERGASSITSNTVSVGRILLASQEMPIKTFLLLAEQ